jgi:hypothetical protein
MRNTHNFDDGDFPSEELPHLGFYERSEVKDLVIRDQILPYAKKKTTLWWSLVFNSKTIPIQT